MSRGHGKVQRAILAALERFGTDKCVGELAEDLFPGHRWVRDCYLPRAIENTIQRALRRLHAEGAVERVKGQHRGLWIWFLAGGIDIHYADRSHSGGISRCEASSNLARVEPP